MEKWLEVGEEDVEAALTKCSKNREKQSILQDFKLVVSLLTSKLVLLTNVQHLSF